MKKFILLAITFVVCGAFAAEDKIICKPTIPTGNVNYDQVNNGLNRIYSIEITNGEAGNGGYGIVINLSGTSGVGKTPANVTHKLPWASAYGAALIEYNNSNVSKSTQANPFIRFEMENMGDAKTFLAALTFSAAKDPKFPRIYNSRYTCQYK